MAVMQRRDFLHVMLTGAAALRMAKAAPQTAPPVFFERAAEGTPHKGKVLLAVQAHSDDLPLFAAGTVAKLVSEGYTGCLIRMTNDEKAGRGATTGEIVLNNERDNDAVARALGLTKVFNLNYRNHRMDNESRQEIRGRLIHIFRLMKVDTIVCYDP